jgi:dCTP deaminase
VILTGAEIVRARSEGDVSIEPFSLRDVNPNSYNYRLGPDLLCLSGGEEDRIQQPVRLPLDGYILEPGNLYLGITHERIGSRSYAMTLLGRSSTGRLGIFLNATADLGHTGSDSHWTLEISVVQPVRVYALMKIGQVAFWTVAGERESYRGRYHRDRRPEPSKDGVLGRTHLEEGAIDTVG